MTNNGIIKCLMALALIAYLVVALSFTSQMAADDTFNGLYIDIQDSAQCRFVSAREIDEELNMLSERICQMSHSELDTYELERQIMRKDNIESANCVVLNDGSLRIDIVPLRPVARVFDRSGDTYYINRAGKHMRATERNSTDVPVIYGRFTGALSPTMAFPLLDYLSQDPEMALLTNAIEIRDNRDLILVPSIKGHVINLGDSTDLPNKMARIKSFYSKVMPVKGWEYYDTLTVKWRGQVVANRRHARDNRSAVVVDEHIDLDDVGTMMAPQDSTSVAAI